VNRVTVGQQQRANNNVQSYNVTIGGRLY